MRLDLFFCFAVRYDVAASDAALLFEVLQMLGFAPKALKRGKKSGKIRFFLPRRQAIPFERKAAEKGLAFSRGEGGITQLGKKLLRAPGLVVGILLSLLLIVGARAVIWDVRVTGTDAMEEAEIEQALAEIGLFRGAFVPALNADEIALSLRQKDTRVGYAAVNIKGTVAYVQIRENEPVPTPSAKNPANLVAACDGVITMPLIFEGECLVETGEVVRTGQILASGLIDTQNHGYRVTRAAGQVMARTVHTYTVRVPLVYEEKVYTGKRTYEVSVLLFQFAQKVFENTNKNIDKCDIIEEIRWLRTPAGALLPFGYRLITTSAYEMCPRTRTVQNARSMALSELKRSLAADSAKRMLLEKNVEWCIDGDAVTLICTVVCEEDIARTAEFALQP